MVKMSGKSAAAASETTPTLKTGLRGAVIFDRDGVLNVDHGYTHRPDDFEWITDAQAAVKAVNDAGLFAFVATNQSGIARGLYPESDVIALHAWMQAELAKVGAQIDAFEYCPHHEAGTVAGYTQPCDRRKPGPGMIRDLLARYPVDPARTVMIGDNDTDMQAAAAAGIRGVKFGGGSLLAAVRPYLAALGPIG